MSSLDSATSGRFAEPRLLRQSPLQLTRHSKGDAVQPAANGRGLLDGCSPTSEHEERGLKGVLRVVAIIQHAATDAQHGGTMTRNQSGKRGFIARLEEAASSSRSDRPSGTGAVSERIRRTAVERVGECINPAPLGYPY